MRASITREEDKNIPWLLIAMNLHHSADGCLQIVPLRLLQGSGKVQVCVRACMDAGMYMWKYPRCVKQIPFPTGTS
jgi:hypothetical protein